MTRSSGERARRIICLAALVAMTSASTALADEETQKKDAEAHFKAGLAFYQQQEWSAALAEFLRSRELFPTRVATLDAAICLRTEKRYDEALDMFEALLREFKDIPPEMRADADKAVADLQQRVGALAITGSEAGATVLVDGRPRGTTPIAAPVRVSIGNHVVRYVKEGFLVTELRVDVAGKDTVRVDARMTALTRSGKLRVREQGGRPLDVLVDGAVVGKTPYEGALELGAHSIALRGEGTLGTQPVSATVRDNQVTALTLVAEDLGAIARVLPTPAGATVAIDGVAVGSGVWEGRLRVGEHHVEVASEGFVGVARDVTLAEGKREVLTVVLERDPASPLWGTKRRSHVVLEIDASAVLAPSLGGDRSTCTGCATTAPIGAHGVVRIGYELALGLGFAFDAGYLIAFSGVDHQPSVLHTIDNRQDLGVADDRFRIGAFTLGASVAIHLGDSWPFTARLGAGAALGSLSDHRTGTFTTSGAMQYAVDRTEVPSLKGFYVAPELRFGRRLGDHAELSVGVEAIVLPLFSQPAWSNEQRILASPDLAHQGDGYVKFDTQTLSARTLVTVNPSLAFRYAL